MRTAVGSRLPGDGTDPEAVIREARRRQRRRYLAAGGALVGVLAAAAAVITAAGPGGHPRRPLPSGSDREHTNSRYSSIDGRSTQVSSPSHRRLHSAWAGDKGCLTTRTDEPSRQVERVAREGTWTRHSTDHISRQPGYQRSLVAVERAARHFQETGRRVKAHGGVVVRPGYIERVVCAGGNPAQADPLKREAQDVDHGYGDGQAGSEGCP